MNQIYIGLAAALSGAIVTYLVARRKNSGSINTSDADVLWTEANAMRQELRDEVVRLRKDLTTANLAIATLQSEVKKLKAVA